MALVQGKDYPEHLYYDLANQIWYEALPDAASVRASPRLPSSLPGRS